MLDANARLESLDGDVSLLWSVGVSRCQLRVTMRCGTTLAVRLLCPTAVAAAHDTPWCRFFSAASGGVDRPARARLVVARSVPRWGRAVAMRFRASCRLRPPPRLPLRSAPRFAALGRQAEALHETLPDRAVGWRSGPFCCDGAAAVRCCCAAAVLPLWELLG